MCPLGYLKLDLRKDKRVPIRLPILVARGDRLSMLIQVGQQGEDIGGLVEVAWIRPAKQFDLFSKETYVMGIRFLDIKCEGKTILACLIEKRIRKMERLER